MQIKGIVIKKGVTYYKLHDSILSFLKDLDFSSLVNNESALDQKIAEDKVNVIKGKITELEHQIQQKEELRQEVSNENMKKRYSQEISELADKLDEQELLLQDQKLIYQNYLKEKKILLTPKQLETILEKSYNDNFYDAHQHKLIEYGSRPDGELQKEGKLKEKKDMRESGI